MRVQTPSDAELEIVARVAGREAWVNLTAPPESHAPRTIAEALAVARFGGAAARRRSRRGRGLTRLQARLALGALTVLVLGACWLISPTRTAIGIFGGALFCLIAFRRRTASARSARRRPFR